jgi:hypothetical protein
MVKVYRDHKSERRKFRITAVPYPFILIPVGEVARILQTGIAEPFSRVIVVGRSTGRERVSIPVI